MRLLLRQLQSPGDILCLTAAVRDLHTTHQDWRINVQTSAMELWENNPHLDRSVTERDADMSIYCQYPAIHRSNERNIHFVYAFHEFLEDQLGVRIERGPGRCDVHLTEQEKHIFDGMPRSTAIIDSGIKQDFTCKGWEVDRFQQVVDRTKDQWHWVQIGASNHLHRPLKGVENLIGKTTHRQLLALMYQASMVLTPVSYPMHLATMEWRYGERRPCVVIAGGREPSAWEAYSGHQFLHRCGCYDCNRRGGCWRSRIVPLHDGSDKDKSICEHPVATGSGQFIPMCMDEITVDEVVRAIEAYKL